MNPPLAFTPLPRSFFEPAADIVAAKLLGHWLIRNTPQGPYGGQIVETEAYLTGDAAAHSFRGQTKRNQVMWGAPGYCYVYFIYGNHWCFNVVCQRPGIAEAVLVRAIEPVIGLHLMQANRTVTQPHQLTNGPGKLCAAMKMDRSMNGVDLCNHESPVFLATNDHLKSFLKQTGPMLTTTRIGITQAATLPLRFCLAGSSYLSRRVAAAKTIAPHKRRDPSPT
jgi:DNA-3-methyladenine glycosylase